MKNHPSQRRFKTVDHLLRVYAWTPGGFLRVGLLELEEEGDREMSATFAYESAYLDHPYSFPLDPLNMPLGESVMATSSPTVTLGALFDAAPDAFGRRVVRASVGPNEQHQVYRNAFLRGADGIGAVILTPDRDMNLEAIVQESLHERPSLAQLGAAADAARELEDGVELDEHTKALLAGSWTIGGARPKAILRDDRPGAAPNSSVIAKFESRAAQVDGRNKLEWATLEMAADVGMPVPRHDLVDLGEHTALVLERFDRVPHAAGVDRRHYVSAASFVSAKPQSKFLDSAFDRAYFSWKGLLTATAAVSASASEGRVQMYSRLAFNAAVRNTDDHLKNFGFLRCVDDPMHYEIAPVFDVSPQGSSTHYLHCADLGRNYTLAQVTAVSRQLGIAQKVANEVRDRIMAVLERRAEYFERAGMTERQVITANAWIEKGTDDLAPMTRSPKSVNRERG